MGKMLIVDHFRDTFGCRQKRFDRAASGCPEQYSLCTSTIFGCQFYVRMQGCRWLGPGWGSGKGMEVANNVAPSNHAAAEQMAREGRRHP